MVNGSTIAIQTNHSIQSNREQSSAPSSPSSLVQQNNSERNGHESNSTSSASSKSLVYTANTYVPLSTVVTCLVDRWSREYLQSAEAGECESMCLVAQMYMDKQGWGAIPPDPTTGRKWLVKAQQSAKGHADRLTHYYDVEAACPDVTKDSVGLSKLAKLTVEDSYCDPNQNSSTGYWSSCSELGVTSPLNCLDSSDVNASNGRINVKPTLSSGAFRLPLPNYDGSNISGKPSHSSRPSSVSPIPMKVFKGLNSPSLHRSRSCDIPSSVVASLQAEVSDANNDSGECNDNNTSNLDYRSTSSSGSVVHDDWDAATIESRCNTHHDNNSKIRTSLEQVKIIHAV